MNKHTTYNDFMKSANNDEKKFFSFSCIRNPIDRTVSYIVKHLNNYYDNSSKIMGSKINIARYYFMQRYNFVKKYDPDFTTFFLKFYRWPYNDWSCLDHDKMDFVIKFENIEEDFAKALDLIGLEIKRPLPRKNITIEKKDEYYSYFSPDSIRRVKKVFGPFMKKWEYEFPPSWGKNDIKTYTLVQFHILNAFRKFYWRFLKGK